MFYEKAVGGTNPLGMFTLDGSEMHGEIKTVDSTVMVNQENPQPETLLIQTLCGSPASIHMHVDDCDAAFKNELTAGC